MEEGNAAAGIDDYLEEGSAPRLLWSAIGEWKGGNALKLQTSKSITSNCLDCSVPVEASHPRPDGEGPYWNATTLA